MVLDRLCHAFERVHVRPLRSIALKAAEEWMLERLELSDGLGAIYPSISELDHRDALPRLLARRSAGDSRAGRVEKLGMKKGSLPHAAPLRLPVWDTATPCLLWARAEWERRSRAW